MSLPATEADAAIGRVSPYRVRRTLRTLRAPIVSAILRRLAVSIPLLFVVSGLVFFLNAIIPFDATHAILGWYATPDQYAALRHRLGLDLPEYQQYWTWVKHALRGDLGTSFINHASVSQMIVARLPTTLSLIGGTLLVTSVLGGALGVFSAVRGGALGKVVDVLAMGGWVLPAFWVAAQSVVLFAVELHWFPATGYTPFSSSPIGWLRSLALPIASLSVGGVGWLAKVTREAMLDAMGSEYVRMARASGLPERWIVLQHALRTAAVPVVTVAGLLAVNLLIGTVFVENVFALPGLGSLVVPAVGQHDFPVVEGVVVFFTLIVVAINLVIDISYTLLNPRVRAW
jgi:peptide/nickel transport system permease protein